MTFKKLGLVTLTAAAAALFVLGTTGASEAKKKAPKVSPWCTSEWAPVCGARGGKRFTYANACYAGNDGAIVVGKGACKKGGGKKKMAKKPAAKKADKKK